MSQPGGALRVRISQRDLPPQDRFPVSFLRQVARGAAQAAGCLESAELSLTLTGDQRVQGLNRQYRGIDGPTDVLSFAMEEGPHMPMVPGLPRLLGDVVVSLETTRRHAQELGVDLPCEMAWVVCHGVLHLLGFDHQSPAEEETMRGLEGLVLGQLGLEHPGRL